MLSLYVYVGISYLELALLWLYDNNTRVQSMGFVCNM